MIPNDLPAPLQIAANQDNDFVPNNLNCPIDRTNALQALTEEVVQNVLFPFMSVEAALDASRVCSTWYRAFKGSEHHKKLIDSVLSFLKTNRSDFMYENILRKIISQNLYNNPCRPGSSLFKVPDFQGFRYVISNSDENCSYIETEQGSFIPQGDVNGNFFYQRRLTLNIDFTYLDTILDKNTELGKLAKETVEKVRKFNLESRLQKESSGALLKRYNSTLRPDVEKIFTAIFQKSIQNGKCNLSLMLNPFMTAAFSRRNFNRLYKKLSRILRYISHQPELTSVQILDIPSNALPAPQEKE